jgi:hypothetical protein
VLKAIQLPAVFSSGISLFGAYSAIFLTGIYFVIIGSIIYVILKARRVLNPFFRIITRTMLYSGLLFLLYYGFLRVIAIKSISTSILGPVLGLFAVTSRMSNLTFMISIGMIIFGFEIKKYANWLKAHHVHRPIELGHHRS